MDGECATLIFSPTFRRNWEHLPVSLVRKVLRLNNETLMRNFTPVGYMNFFSQFSVLIGLFFANYVIDLIGEINLTFSGVAVQAATFLAFAYVK